MTRRARQKPVDTDKGEERQSLSSDKLVAYRQGWGPLFDAIDIDHLANIAGHSLVDARDREALAFLLKASFVDAGRAEMLAPVLANRDFESRFGEIHEAASRLALLLGFQRGEDGPLLPKTLSEKNGRHRKYTNDYLRNYRTAELSMLQRVADNRAAANSASHAVALAEGLQNLPESLVALLEISRALAGAPRRRSRGGRPTKRGQQQLFMNLAEVFYLTFGIPAASGRGRDDPGEASLRWALEVIRIANDRIASQVMLNLPDDERSLRTPDHPAVIVAKEAAALRPATVADRLCRGWKDRSSLGSRNKPLKDLFFPLTWKLAAELDGLDPGDNSTLH